MASRSLLVQDAMFTNVGRGLLRSRQRPLLINRGLFVQRHRIGHRIFISRGHRIFTRGLLRRLGRVGQGRLSIVIGVKRTLVVGRRVRLVFNVVGLLLRTQAIRSVHHVNRRLRYHRQHLRLVAPGSRVVMALFRLLLGFLHTLVGVILFFARLTRRFSFGRHPTGEFIGVTAFGTSRGSGHPRNFGGYDASHCRPNGARRIASRARFRVVGRTGGHGSDRTGRVCGRYQPAVHRVFPSRGFSSGQ